MCTLTKTAGHAEKLTRLQQVRTNNLGCDLSSGSGSAMPLFQIFAKLDGATTTINVALEWAAYDVKTCLLYTSPSPRDQRGSRMPSSA